MEFTDLVEDVQAPVNAEGGLVDAALAAGVASRALFEGEKAKEEKAPKKKWAAPCQGGRKCGKGANYYVPDDPVFAWAKYCGELGCGPLTKRQYQTHKATRAAVKADPAVNRPEKVADAKAAYHRDRDAHNAAQKAAAGKAKVAAAAEELNIGQCMQPQNLLVERQVRKHLIQIR